jgi:hypothetical protein
MKAARFIGWPPWVISRAEFLFASHAGFHERGRDALTSFSESACYRRGLSFTQKTAIAVPCSVTNLQRKASFPADPGGWIFGLQPTRAPLVFCLRHCKLISQNEFKPTIRQRFGE